MTTPEKCPSCLSKFPNIRGMVYPTGPEEAHRCENSWHYGPGWPNTLDLNEADKKLLHGMFIKV